jgi:hypothetical protein
VADDLVRIEVGLDGGQILSALVSAASADSLDAALRAGAVSTVELAILVSGSPLLTQATSSGGYRDAHRQEEGSSHAAD